MKSVSVLGATGFLGGRLTARLREQAAGRLAVTGAGWRHANAKGLAPVDVTDARSLAAHLEQEFDFVIVAAGTKDVERCERDPGFAHALNAEVPARLAQIARTKGLATRFILLSTDYVFDGLGALRRELEPTRPATTYGRSKLAGERALLDARSGHKVVRAAAVLGPGARFFDWLLGEVAAGREVRLFDDCFNSPTPAELLCDALLDLLDAYDQVSEEILHVVGERRLSRHELGCLILRLRPVSGASVVSDRRPPGSLLQQDLSLAQSAFVRARQRHAMEEYLARELRGA